MCSYAHPLLLLLLALRFAELAPLLLVQSAPQNPLAPTPEESFDAHLPLGLHRVPRRLLSLHLGLDLPDLGLVPSLLELRPGRPLAV